MWRVLLSLCRKLKVVACKFVGVAVWRHSISQCKRLASVVGVGEYEETWSIPGWVTDCQGNSHNRVLNTDPVVRKLITFYYPHAICSYKPSWQERNSAHIFIIMLVACYQPSCQETRHIVSSSCLPVACYQPSCQETWHIASSSCLPVANNQSIYQETQHIAPSSYRTTGS